MLAPVGRLPGVAIEALPRALPDRLPRMDIAGFVGFATSGPLHRPVVVEDAARFADVFGEDLELVAGESGREPVFAHLAASVRAFFANGGRRCWVVRVAEPDIEPQVFPVPGLVAIGRDGDMRPAFARARSPGSWTDRLTLETTLRPRRIPGAGLADQGEERLLSWPLRHGEPPVPGDLLRLRFTSEGRERLAFLPVAQAPARQEPAFTLPFRAAESLWLRQPAALELPAQVTVPLADGSAREVAASAGAGGAGAFRLEGVAPAAVQPGLALPVRLAGEDGTGGIVLVARTAPERDPASGALVALNVVPDALWVLEEEPPADPGALLDVVRLRFDLVARELETRRWRIAGLGLVRDDARFWATLPDDLTLFPPPDGPEPERAREALGALALEASRPRFPLAGPPDAGEVRLFLPLGMGASPDAGTRATALGEVDPASRLERDGLGTFAAALFLDPDLAGIGQTFHDLPGRALDKRYLRRDPQPLRGLHALYFLDEVTLLAAPDAVHGGWESEQRAPEVRLPLVAPVLELIEEASSPPHARWSHPGPDGLGYELEQATDPAFGRVQRRYRTAAREVALGVHDCPEDLWFRVRGLSEREPSPWSNTVHARMPAPDFDDCAREAPLAAPALSLPDGAGSGARFRVTWTRIEGASRYRLEQSGEPASEDAAVLALVDQPETGTPGFEVLHGVTERTFWRVRAETVGEDGELVEVGPWSATALALPPAAPQGRLVRGEPEEADPIALEVHLAMLRMAAARADMLAVLSCDGGTGLARALAHRQALVEELGFDEEAALAFGAL